MPPAAAAASLPCSAESFCAHQDALKDMIPPSFQMSYPSLPPPWLSPFSEMFPMLAGNMAAEASQAGFRDRQEGLCQNSRLCHPRHDSLAQLCDQRGAA